MKNQKAAFSAANQPQSDYSTFSNKSKDNQYNFENRINKIPSTMKALNQWLLWQLRDNKKVPLNLSYNPTNPTKGFTFNEVMNAYNPNNCDGLGFVVGSGVVAVDIDHCIENGKISKFAQKLIDELKTYTEISISGTGIHLFYMDISAKEIGRKNKQLEIYTHKHYIAMTGNSIGNSDLALLTGKTNELLEQYFPNRNQTKEEHTQTSYNLSDEEVLHRALLMNNKTFNTLFYDGNIEGYASQSEADSALLVKLALLTGCMEEQMRELFNQSALGKRDKWADRPDYQDLQINNAVNYVKSTGKMKAVHNLTNLTYLTPQVFTSAAICKLTPELQEFYEEFMEFCRKNTKKLGMSMPEIKRLISASEKEQFTINVSKQLDKLPALKLPQPYDKIEYIIPEGYKVTSHGIYAINKSEYKCICKSAIFITQEITARNSKRGKCQLYAFTLGKGWKCLDFIEDKLLCNARFMSSELPDKLPTITSHNCQALVSYFDEFRSLNYNTIQQLESTEKLGWNGKEFITPYNPGKYVLDNANNFIQTLTLTGKFEIWKSIVQPAFEYSFITRFILSAGFASVLLEPLSSRSFCTYVWGNTASGKSTIFQLVESIWGSPDGVISFGGTLNGFEGNAAERNGFPTVIDEKQQKRESTNPSTFIMRITNGRSDSRAHKDGTSVAIKSWYTILFANGEEPLVEDNVTNGINTRTISLALDDVLLPENLMYSIWETVINNHYGHAGKLFVDYLKSVNWNDLIQRKKELISTLQQKFPQHYKEQINHIAVVAIAEQLVSECIFDQPSKSEQMAEEIITMLDTKAELDNSEKFWEHLVSWIAANQSHFVNSPAATVTLTPCYGEYKKDCLVISKSALSDEFKSWSNLNANKIIKDLHKGGYIISYTETNGKLRLLWNVTVNRINNIKCIKIPLNKLMN